MIEITPSQASQQLKENRDAVAVQRMIFRMITDKDGPYQSTFSMGHSYKPSTEDAEVVDAFIDVIKGTTLYQQGFMQYERHEKKPGEPDPLKLIETWHNGISITWGLTPKGVERMEFIDSIQRTFLCLDLETLEPDIWLTNKLLIPAMDSESFNATWVQRLLDLGLPGLDEIRNKFILEKMSRKHSKKTGTDGLGNSIEDLWLTVA